MLKKLGKIDLTKGNILLDIVLFSLPMLAGNLFQQLYNAVDTWVIGWSGDQAAYAAVGSVGTVTRVFVAFSSGLSVGAGVVIAHYFGGKRDEEVSKGVHTTIALSLVLAAVLTVVGIATIPLTTKVLFGDNGDPLVVAAGKEYLIIYFIGLVGLFLYNSGAAILRAVGDSLRPFYFLVITTVLNTILDVIFVFLLKWGVKGVACATIIAQGISAVLCMLLLMKNDTAARLIVRKIRFHKEQLRRIVLIGLPNAIQGSITSISNVFVHRYMANADGNQVVNLAAYTTETRIDNLVQLPAISFGSAVSTFVAQNLGAGQKDRAEKGIWITMLVSLGICAIMSGIILLFPTQMAAFFNPDTEVVAMAKQLILILTPFRIIGAYSTILASSMRGSGNSVWPSIAIVASYVVLRQIFLFVVTTYISNSFVAVVSSLPFGWIMGAVILTIMMLAGGFGKQAKFHLVKEKKEKQDS